ncbi:hypothetical protein BDQ17DRAFT_1355494 [Cyathus striatus]|nr:hypothetical protein BDQ17DRAFT_1355494 [Cyathus striatus]
MPSMDIPEDIWLQVSQYIDENDLRSLLSVNSVFFRVAMDARYRCIDVNSRDLPTERLLCRILDKEVARRVRVLRLLFNNVKSETRTKSSSPLKHFKQLGHVLHGRHHRSARSDRLPSPLTFSVVLDVLISALPNMINVEELYFDSWDLPSEYDIHSFFIAAWSSFGRTVRKVYLSGHLEGYCQLLNSTPSFDSVRDVRFEFVNPLRTTNTITTVPPDTIISFVNHLAPQLYALKVWLWTTLDLSPFFDSMDSLSCLESLSIRMSFNQSLSNLPALQRFLHNTSSTVQKLELRLNPLGANFNPSIEDSLGQWFTSCLRDEQIFSYLRKLDIYPTNLPSSTDILVNVIERSSHHLEDMSVRDRYFHDDEVSTIVNVLSTCNKLVSLRLNIWRLDAKLFDLLASKLPQLLRLALYVGDVVTEHTGSMESFIADMEDRKYENWKLYDIGLWQSGNGMNHAGYMTSLARSIPSVKSFWGTGSTKCQR